MTFPKLYHESVGELRSFLVSVWKLGFNSATLNPRLIHVVSEVFRSMDKLQGLMSSWLGQPLHWSALGDVLVVTFMPNMEVKRTSFFHSAFSPVER